MFWCFQYATKSGKKLSSIWKVALFSSQQAVELGHNQLFSRGFSAFLRYFQLAGALPENISENFLKNFKIHLQYGSGGGILKSVSSKILGREGFAPLFLAKKGVFL